MQILKSLASAALCPGPSSSPSDAPSAAASPSSDPRAALILRLMLNCAPGGAYAAASEARPSFAHLLMGYDVAPSMGGIEESMLLPRWSTGQILARI